MSSIFNRRRIALLSVVVLAVVMMASGAAQQRSDPQNAVNNAFHQFQKLKGREETEINPGPSGRSIPNLFGNPLLPR